MLCMDMITQESETITQQVSSQAITIAILSN